MVPESAESNEPVPSKPAKPSTSFVIASRDRSGELVVVVERLLDTTACPIVFVDNSSLDDSVAAVRKVASKAANRVEIIELSENLGAVGRNVGVAHCTTAYVAFCDDDSWWEPQAPTIAEELFAAHPTLGLLAARTVVWPDQTDDPMVEALAASPLGHRSSAFWRARRSSGRWRSSPSADSARSCTSGERNVCSPGTSRLAVGTCASVPNWWRTTTLPRCDRRVPPSALAACATTR
jgi:hypothetical protein